jgi:hypothetical protein
MDEVTVWFSVGTYGMIEQIGEVKRAAGLFSGTGQRCEGAF